MSIGTIPAAAGDGPDLGNGVPIVEASEVNFHYPDGTAALHAVSLEVYPGEIVAVLGPSGAGKSTLFRCLAGLQNPQSGTITVEGTDLSTVRGRRRREALARIGLVFQEFHLVGRATVLSNVLIGCLHDAPLVPSLFHAVSRTSRERAVELLLRVGLGEQIRKRADALSGGQRQRVALARALAQGPTLLLADEPVANLDPMLAAGVVDDIVRMVRAEGLTTVLNLHDVELARRVAGRLVGMRAGEIIFDLPVADVTEEHLHRLYGGSGHREALPPSDPPTSADNGRLQQTANPHTELPELFV